MTQSLRCNAVPGRRAVLFGASGLAALLARALPARAAGPGLADLVAADGNASDLALSLAQTTVTVRGYLAPSLDGRLFTVTEGSVLPCQLCGALHDAGASIAVHTAAPLPDAPVFEIVRVSGRLETGDGVRLVDARIQAA